MNSNIESVLIYISTHFQQPLNIKMLADKANMSEFHFYRVFKKETATTPQKYVEKLRLEHAAHVMALNPQIKKTHLAFDSGFQSPSSFSRSFSKYFGYSPTALLQKQQENQEIPLPVQKRMEQMESVDICYISGFSLHTQLISLEENHIQNKLDIDYSVQTEIIYGVYLDPPFHKPLNACRFLIGTKTEEKSAGNFAVEGGYFLRMSIQGPFHHNKDEILAQHQGLEKNGYRIKYPMGIEKLNWNPHAATPYLQTQRELFIPVIR